MTVLRPTRIAVVALCLGVNGCAGSPERPSLPETPERWALPMVDGAPDGLARWWEHFEDPALIALVTRTHADNPSLQAALARLRAARAQREAVTARHWPVLDAEAGASRQRLSRNGSLPVDTIPGFQRSQTLYDAGLAARWELDVFGRLDAQLGAADAALSAQTLEAQGLRASLAAEMARTYFGWAGAARTADLVLAQYHAAKRQAEIAERRFEVGDIEASAAAIARTEAEQLRAEAASAAAARDAYATVLAELIGQPLTALHLPSDPPPLPALPSLPTGTPASVLQRRPDVRAAGWRVAQRLAQAEGARAEWFPRLQLSASSGFEAMTTGALFNAASQTALLAPAMVWRVFDGGAIRAEIAAADAEIEAAAANYRATMMGALAEVERAQARYRRHTEASRAQRRAASEQARAYAHAKARAAAGDIPQATLLDARRAYLAQTAQAVRSHADAAVAAVALYQALGGGLATRANNDQERMHHAEIATPSVSNDG
ncbi:efflux transporter outer membrane subunit [Algiphilus sp.]|uniref:efflux transporter outer membrane subunit n=1 Tax=Algiphilus sp. TaxID=1872431 RepID=UPI002A5E9022|nr:efflux transporter outer membrane subunit [Pseudomonadota bacterium]